MNLHWGITGKRFIIVGNRIVFVFKRIGWFCIQSILVVNSYPSPSPSSSSPWHTFNHGSPQERSNWVSREAFNTTFNWVYCKRVDTNGDDRRWLWALSRSQFLWGGGYFRQQYWGTLYRHLSIWFERSFQQGHPSDLGNVRLVCRNRHPWGRIWGSPCRGRLRPLVWWRDKVHLSARKANPVEKQISVTEVMSNTNIILNRLRMERKDSKLSTTYCDTKTFERHVLMRRV